MVARPLSDRFAAKVVLITGAAGGIGIAAAKQFAAEGAQVALIDLEQRGLSALAADIGIKDASCHVIDVSEEAAVASCIEDVVKRFGRLDVVFNNAGVICAMEVLEEQSVADWQRVLGINLLGAMLFTKHAAPHLIAQCGAIVNTASVAGIRAGAGGNAYSASKAAVINLTQTTACDLGKHGVRVNAVCPGLKETCMTRPVFDFALANNKEDRLGSRCELRRFGRPEEIATVVAFLASDDASYITGQALAVDGGNTASLNLPGMKF